MSDTETPVFTDKEIDCVEPGCGKFTWSARDQEFYARMKFFPPKRCPAHAKARRKAFNDRKQDGE